MKQRHVIAVIGTRPEAIKMAPVILELRRRPGFGTTILLTAQHREMLDQAMSVFGLEADLDLDLMVPGQSLAATTTRVLAGLDAHLSVHPADVVLAQGDTTTVMATAMACFYRGIPFGHVEAGLRTGNLQAPFPEEFNRRVAALATRFHFAPTDRAARALRDEGISDGAIHVTGNTVVDAVHHIMAHTAPPALPIPAGKRFVLMTCHRRESFGATLRGIFHAVRSFAERHPDVTVWYPVHPNPSVLEPATAVLGGVPNVLLTKPVDYVTCLHAIRACHVLLTDSGGIQEEAATLGKPVLVMREVTERPEGVEAGFSRLVGTSPDVILSSLEELWSSPGTYERMTHGRTVYGDGRAAVRIADVLAGA